MPRLNYTRKEIQCPFYMRLAGPQGRSGRVRKISPPPGFYPLTVQSIASRYTDWATPAHTVFEFGNIFLISSVTNMWLFSSSSSIIIDSERCNCPVRWASASNASWYIQGKFYLAWWLITLLNGTKHFDMLLFLLRCLLLSKLTCFLSSSSSSSSSSLSSQSSPAQWVRTHTSPCFCFVFCLSCDCTLSVCLFVCVFMYSCAGLLISLVLPSLYINRLNWIQLYYQCIQK